MLAILVYFVSTSDMKKTVYKFDERIIFVIKDKAYLSTPPKIKAARLTKKS
jgi:hypothetical protein